MPPRRRFPGEHVLDRVQVSRSKGHRDAVEPCRRRYAYDNDTMNTTYTIDPYFRISLSPSLSRTFSHSPHAPWLRIRAGMCSTWSSWGQSARFASRMNRFLFIISKLRIFHALPTIIMMLPSELADDCNQISLRFIVRVARFSFLAIS